MDPDPRLRTPLSWPGHGLAFIRNPGNPCTMGIAGIAYEGVPTTWPRERRAPNHTSAAAESGEVLRSWHRSIWVDR